MKWMLLLACGCSLLFTTGCLCSPQEWRGHHNNADFGGMTEAPATVEVHGAVPGVRPADARAR